jgi:hypothetical protein
MATSWMKGCSRTKHKGIFKTERGYRVRVRAVDSKTGTLKERNEEFENITVEEAIVKRAELKTEIRRGRTDQGRQPVRYADYTESLLKKKLAKRKFRSKKGRRTWVDLQDLHLIPAFGDWFIGGLDPVS